VSRTHSLKTWPGPFAAIVNGSKTHEIRVDDRGYMVGDVLHLREYDPAGVGRWTGEECWVDVTYVTPGGQWQMPPHLCVMSIRLRRTP
jgi:Domain of unknown function (DUF3850)